MSCQPQENRQLRKTRDLENVLEEGTTEGEEKRS